MRRKLLVLLALVVVLSLVIAVPVGAKKPAPKLEGSMELFIDFPTDFVFDCYDMEGSIYTWRGTVTFPELGPYAMAFVNLGTGKAFVDDDPDNPFPPGQAGFFTEFWAIYEGDVVVTDNDGCPLLEGAAIWGTDSGVGTSSNSTYRMNGDVEVATGDFAGWLGRKVHMSGTFDQSTTPWEAPGIFRLN